MERTGSDASRGGAVPNDGEDDVGGRKKQLLSKYQASVLEECFTTHSTLHPVLRSHLVGGTWRPCALPTTRLERLLRPWRRPRARASRRRSWWYEIGGSFRVETKAASCVMVYVQGPDAGLDLMVAGW